MMNNKSIKKSFLNILSRTRELVLTCNFLTILYLRSFHVVYFTVMVFVTALGAKILKRVIKQPRPPRLLDGKLKTKKSYGMPSSHSAVIFFLNSYLQCIFNSSLEWKNVIMLIFFHAFAISVVWSRVRLGHHTKSQVVAGSIFGFLCALGAFYLWEIYFSTLNFDGHVDNAFTYFFNLRTR